MRVFVNSDDLGAVYTELQFKDSTSLDEFAIIYPHIGIKNMRVQVNFGVELPDPELAAWPLPAYLNDKEYKFFGELKNMSSALAPTPRPPLSKADCTVIFVSHHNKEFLKYYLIGFRWLDFRLQENLVGSTTI